MPGVRDPRGPAVLEVCVKEIVQHAIIRVIRPQIVRYTCDFCGQICGTRDNPKKTWYVAGGGEKHYCMKTCSPWSAEETMRALADIGRPRTKRSWYER